MSQANKLSDPLIEQLEQVKGRVSQALELAKSL